MNRLEENFKHKALVKGYTVLENGWPDFLIMKGTQFMAVEVKSGNDPLRENQIEMLKTLTKAGIKCYVYREFGPESSDTVFMHINEILGERNKRVLTNFENNWKEGFGHLQSGITSLKEIGLNDETIVFHLNRILSNWAKEGEFRE